MLKKYLNLIRFKSQTGTLLLFFPCAFGLLFGGLHNHDLPSMLIFLKFFFGAFFARSAGCIINDIWDRKFDGNVKRTSKRPMATGEIKIKNALILFIIFLTFALLIILTINTLVAIICVVAFLLSIIYPLLKRFTYYPQVLLGFLFNIGIIAGFFSVSQNINYSIILPYLGFILWTIIYDTIYAMQDIKDDLLIGVKSTAIKFGNSYKFILHILNIFYFILLMCFWLLNNLHFPFFVLVSFLVLAVLIKKSNQDNFAKMFKLNLISCLILCIGLFLNYAACIQKALYITS